MTVVTPEAWYRLYWTLMGCTFLVAAYFVVRYAVRWGVEHGMERFVSKEPKSR